MKRGRRSALLANRIAFTPAAAAMFDGRVVVGRPISGMTEATYKSNGWPQRDASELT